MSAEIRHGEFVFSSDKSAIDFDVVHGFLTRSYWSPGIPAEVVQRAIENSMCFCVHACNPDGTRRQVGFARAITDKATYAYLSDVFILEEFRGRGLSKWLIAQILAHPELQGLRRVALMTRDAQGLYSRFGFAHLDDTTRYMEIRHKNVYGHRASSDSDGAC